MLLMKQKKKLLSRQERGLGKKNSFPKRMEEIIDNLKRIEVIAEVTLRKLKELNAKNNSNS